MAYTTIDQLEKVNGSVELGPGTNSRLYDPGRTLFYAKDIEIVKRQSLEPSLLAKEFPVEIILVRFNKENDFNETDIPALAARDNSGAILEFVALAWAPFYHEEDIRYRAGAFLPKDL